MTDADPELLALQQRWSPAWDIWRARGSKDPATNITRQGSLCASLIDESAGVSPFLMTRSPEVMNAALEAQAAAAADKPYDPATLVPPLMS
jgi:hypothetical protein